MHVPRTLVASGQVLRSMLGLDNSASSHAILASLRQALDLSTTRSIGGAADGEASAEVIGMETADGSERGASRTLPEYVAIAAELRKLTHAESVLDIVRSSIAHPTLLSSVRIGTLSNPSGIAYGQVPAVKEMKEKLSDYRHANAQIQVVAAQLCTTLALGSSEAELAQRLRDLVIS